MSLTPDDIRRMNFRRMNFRRDKHRPAGLPPAYWTTVEALHAVCCGYTLILCIIILFA